METCSPVMNKVVLIPNAEGKKVPLSVCSFILRDKNDQVIGVVKTCRDLSLVEELRKELKGRYTFEDIIVRKKAKGFSLLMVKSLIVLGVN